MKKISKTISLLNLLNASEIGVLKKKLARDKKLRLLVVTESLIKLKNKPFGDKERSSLHKKLFGEPYTSKKDYLLRNEFRLLNRQIEDTLVETEIREEMESSEILFHYHLLQSLQKRKALDLFQKEYTSSYDQALEQQDYYLAHNMANLNFINYTQFVNLKSKDLHYIERLNELQLAHLSCYYLVAFRQYQIDQQYLHTTVSIFSTEQNPLQKELTVDFEPYETNYSDYLYLKAKSYVAPLVERPAILQQCQGLAEHHLKSNDSLFDAEVKFCLSALARTYSLLCDFAIADQYFQEALAKFSEPDDAQRLAIVTDCAANFINLAEYEQALHLLEENLIFMESIPRLQLYCQCLQTACYAFLEDVPNLNGTLPESFTDYNAQTKYFFRFYFAIASSVDEQHETAYRELENMRHINSPEEEEIHPVVNFLHRYFYTLFHHPFQDTHYTHNLSRLAVDVQAFAESAIPEMRSYLPFLWLKKKLQLQK